MTALSKLVSSASVIVNESPTVIPVPFSLNGSAVAVVLSLLSVTTARLFVPVTVTLLVTRVDHSFPNIFTSLTTNVILRVPLARSLLVFLNVKFESAAL